MKIESINLREKFLIGLGKVFSVSLKGDQSVFSPPVNQIKVSCIINFFGRLDLLSGILHSLANQDYPRESFEVILVEDRGGTDAGKIYCHSFDDRLNIVYRPLDENFGKMGYSRNYAIGLARGSFILLLDDDTVLLQNNFLSILEKKFLDSPHVDAVVPKGEASYGLLENRYDYHEPYFMTSRCMAYKRETLESLGGFVNSIIGQEDVEFVTRFVMSGRKRKLCSELKYYHPPLLVHSLGKPKAVGQSFAALRQKYPLILFALLMINCCRHFPLIFIPKQKFQMKGRFALGFLIGVTKSFFKKTPGQYRD